MKKVLKKKMRQVLNNNERGITLIALVITVIVLLILAGVSIATLTGENGILTRASEADIETRAVSVEERKNLWKMEKQTDNYMGENTAQTLGELLEDLEGEGLITTEEKNKIEEKGHVVIGSKDISFSEGLTEASYTITNSLDEVNFNKIITEGDIAVEKPGFTSYMIEGVSYSKEGEYVTSGGVAGKSGNLEIIGNISDTTFKYILTNFMQGDETFYCKINIDGEVYYKEIKVIQGSVVTYEEDFAGITYEGTMIDEENENFTNGKAKYINEFGSIMSMQIQGTAFDIRTVKGENMGSIFCMLKEINEDNTLGKTVRMFSLECQDEGTDYVNFSDAMGGNIIYLDKDDTTKNKRIQVDLNKVKRNIEEQVGDRRVYIDAIYVYK